MGTPTQDHRKECCLSRFQLIPRFRWPVWSIPQNLKKIHLIRPLGSPLEERLGGFHETDFLSNGNGDPLAE